MDYIRASFIFIAFCLWQAIGHSQIIQGKPAPPVPIQIEDVEGYSYPPVTATKQQQKVQTAAQNAVINYLGAPAVSTHFSSKLAYYLSSTLSSRNVIEAGLIAGLPNLPTAPSQPHLTGALNAATGSQYEAAFQAYGEQIDNWRRTSETQLRFRGDRAAVGLATAETRVFLSDLLLPIAFRQVGRYEPADLDASFGSRLGHAIASVVVARNDRGRLAPNYSKLLGTTGAALAGRFYYADALGQKELASNRFIGKYIGYSFAGDLATNVTHELVRSAVKQDIMLADEEGPALQESYYPLTFGGKFLSWTRSTYGSRNFIAAGLLAGLPNITTQPGYPTAPEIDSVDAELTYDRLLVQYGASEQSWRDSLEQDIRYHGRRFIAGLSESETQTTLAKLVLPVAMHMEPRYIPLGPGHSPGARLANAFVGLAVTRMDSGRRVPNIPLLGGTVGAAFIAREYYFPELGVSQLASNQVLEKTIGLNIGGDLLIHLVSEFFPRRTF